MCWHHYISIRLKSWSENQLEMIKHQPYHTLVVDNLLVSCFTPIGKVDLEKQHVVEVEEQWSWSRGCSPTIAITSGSIPIKTDTHPSWWTCILGWALYRQCSLFGGSQLRRHCRSRCVIDPRKGHEPHRFPSFPRLKSLSTALSEALRERDSYTANLVEMSRDFHSNTGLKQKKDVDDD